MAQTQQLFRHYNGQPQTASPATCADAESAGPLLLPTLSFGSGNASFDCRTSRHRVLADLGGFIATEDARGDTYTLADGEVLTYTRANLERICTDAVRFLPGPAPASYHGAAVIGTEVTTRVFRVHVRPGADSTPGQPYYQDSVDLGHPGTLHACYFGYKTILRVERCAAVLKVDLSAYAGSATTFTYTIRAGRPSRY